MTKQLTAADIEAAFAAAGEARNNRKCTVGQLLEQEPALEPRIMDVEHYSAKYVSRVLKALDLYRSDAAITKHRKGDCICPKETS